MVKQVLVIAVGVVGCLFGFGGCNKGDHYIDISGDPSTGFAKIAGTQWVLKEDLFFLHYPEGIYDLEIPGEGLPTVAQFTASCDSLKGYGIGQFVEGIVSRGTRFRVDSLKISKGVPDTPLVWVWILDGPYAGKTVEIHRLIYSSIETTRRPGEWVINDKYLKKL